MHAHVKRHIHTHTSLYRHTKTKLRTKEGYPG